MRMHFGRGCRPEGRGWAMAGRGSRAWGPFTVEWDIGGAPGSFGFGGGGGGGRGRRRMFGGDELRLLLLMLIADEPRHGYDLIREIEARTGGAYAPSPGVVYPTLTLLAEMGLIEEQASEGAKKRYAATEAGKAHLEEQHEAVAAIVARVTEIGAMRERTDGGPVRRAMGNLRAALRERLHREGEIDRETLLAIAAILDEATQKVERS